MLINTIFYSKKNKAMNVTLKLCQLQCKNNHKNVYRNLYITCKNYNSSSSTQPKVKDDKFDFEDLKKIERQERRKEKNSPFMKDIFISIFNRELLAYPEILNKEEATILNNRIKTIEGVFQNPKKSETDRKNVLKENGLYGAPVCVSKGGFGMNVTEGLSYLDVIASDPHLGIELSNHWVSLNILKLGLSEDIYDKIINDLITGDSTITVCVKEILSERMMQADFKTTAEINSQGMWCINGEKICLGSSKYQLVLALAEANRFKAFLVHPNASGVTFNKNIVKFHNTPATLLETITDNQLSDALGVMRLYRATVCRNSLLKSMRFCKDYVRPLFFSGKPFSELPNVRSVFGEAMATAYASESAEYFTAGLIDGYVEPDIQVEAAMCRNFIAKRAPEHLLKILAIPGVERQQECVNRLEEMRMLTLQEENLDHVNGFIAMSGLQHAGKAMFEEVKMTRNPYFNPMFVIKNMLQNRHQQNDDPKLTLKLIEHLHPSLRMPAECLEYSVLRMKYASEILLARHGADIILACLELHRLAEAATEIFAMAAALARASRAYCIGVKNANVEMALATFFVAQSKERVKTLIKEIEYGEYVNHDHFRVNYGKKYIDSKTPLVEKPTVRVFW